MFTDMHMHVAMRVHTFCLLPCMVIFFSSTHTTVSRNILASSRIFFDRFSVLCVSFFFHAMLGCRAIFSCLHVCVGDTRVYIYVYTHTHTSVHDIHVSLPFTAFRSISETIIQDYFHAPTFQYNWQNFFHISSEFVTDIGKLKNRNKKRKEKRNSDRKFSLGFLFILDISWKRLLVRVSTEWIWLSRDWLY